MSFLTVFLMRKSKRITFLTKDIFPGTPHQNFIASNQPQRQAHGQRPIMAPVGDVVRVTLGNLFQGPSGWRRANRASE